MRIHFGATPVSVWTIKHLIAPLQLGFYRLTGGVGFTRKGADHGILLLTTKGRRTGKDRTTPVFYLRDDESIVLCNVNPGFEHSNPWVLNICANPLVKLQIGGAIGSYQARKATEPEIQWLWPRLLKVWPAYQDHYARNGKRAIFLLEHY